MATQKQVDILSDALRQAAGRFEDLALLIERGESYQNAGFMRQSAKRCRQAIAGKPFDQDPN